MKEMHASDGGQKATNMVGVLERAAAKAAVKETECRTELLASSARESALSVELQATRCVELIVCVVRRSSCLLLHSRSR